MTDPQHRADPGQGLLDSEEGFSLVTLFANLPLRDDKAILRYKIVTNSGASQAQYRETHGKLMHLYLVRADLAIFLHVHPTFADGVWSVSAKIPEPGVYRMYIDFDAVDTRGADHPIVLSRTFMVPGQVTPVPLPQPILTSTADGYTANLSAMPKSGSLNLYDITITQAGRPVTDLHRFLGSFAHLTAIQRDTFAFAHVHPLDPDPTATSAGPTLTFHAQFVQPGLYRMFLQIETTTGPHTIPMTLNVS